MPNKKNPLNLNALQLRTLVLFQALARLPEATAEGPEAGEITVNAFPQPHADHFHLGDAVVSGRDATGVFNETVWNALARKGLARSGWPESIVLTAAGQAYETGLEDEVLRHGH